MTSPTPQKKARFSDACAVVVVVTVAIAGLVAFEQISGLPASIRGTPVYNVMPMPSSATKYNKLEESRIPTVSSLTKERVCDRISRSFGWDSDMWERVSARVFQRLGFKCRQ
jgi:hypothetical protein